jgi:hypothetical protein
VGQVQAVRTLLDRDTEIRRERREKRREEKRREEKRREEKRREEKRREEKRREERKRERKRKREREREKGRHKRGQPCTRHSRGPRYPQASPLRLRVSRHHFGSLKPKAPP